MEQKDRKWYHKKRSYALGAIAIFAMLALANSDSGASTQIQPEVRAVAPVVQPYVAAPSPVYTHSTASVNTPLSNNNYYTNVDGNQVHSPAYAPSAPANASARCGDGTYSFSQHHQGTCSHHGGVSTWLD